MKSQFRLPGGDLEYVVLSKLWELGSASARDIHQQVGEPAKLVFLAWASAAGQSGAGGRRGTFFSHGLDGLGG